MARLNSRSKVDDYFRQVADSLIEQIRENDAPWEQAWEPGEKVMPCNVETGRRYRGGNSIWLASTAKTRGYSDERWGTFRQVGNMGGHVRRGEKGCRILFWQVETKRIARDRNGAPILDDKGKPVYEVRKLASPRGFTYTVFNAEQCSGLPPRPQRPGSYTWDKHDDAERLLKRCGALIEHTSEDRAWYDLSRDRIVVPHKSHFSKAPGYYQTTLHELGHWTGHPDRMNRETLRKSIEEGFGSPNYAREEIRAEISSMITGDRLELGHEPAKNAAYVKSWVQALHDDPREIYRAAKDAHQMSDYLLERARIREPLQEQRIRSAVVDREDRATSRDRGGPANLDRSRGIHGFDRRGASPLRAHLGHQQDRDDGPDR